MERIKRIQRKRTKRSLMSKYNFHTYQIAWPKLASPTEIPAEANATPLFLLPSSSSTSSTCTLIHDSVTRLKID